MKEVLAHPWVQAGAQDAEMREQQAGGGVGGVGGVGGGGSAPPVGVGISESEVRKERR